MGAATPFNFSGNLSSSGVQTAGQGRVSYSLIRTSSPSATIFDQSQGLSPNINGTLQPGSYQYRVHGDASNDFCCSTTGTETDSYNYNVQLNVGTPAASTVPSNVTPPSISGTAAPGQTLSCSNGTWTNGPTGFTYQWNRDGAAISGATNQTYVVQPADQGHTLTCTVTASNSGGTSSPSTSAGVLVPAAQAPAAATCSVSSTGKVRLAANLSDTPPRKRHGPKPRAKHFRLAAVNGTVRAGVTVVLNRKLSAQAVRDLLHGARESADLTLTAHNANGTSHATGHLARLRT